MKPKGKILSGKGKEWSEEAVAVMDNFTAWLSFSNIGKEECLRRVNGDDFQLSFLDEKGKAQVCLSDEAGGIGAPFVWDVNSGIAKEDFLLSVGLVLAHIGSMCDNAKTKATVKNFIRKVLKI